jgi:hypothetical protein
MDHPELSLDDSVSPCLPRAIHFWIYLDFFSLVINVNVILGAPL